MLKVLYNKWKRFLGNITTVGIEEPFQRPHCPLILQNPESENTKYYFRSSAKHEFSKMAKINSN